MTDNQQPGRLQRWWQQRKIHQALVILAIGIGLVRITTSLHDMYSSSTDVARVTTSTATPEPTATNRGLSQHERDQLATAYRQMTVTSQHEIELTRTEALIFATERAQYRINRTAESQRGTTATVQPADTPHPATLPPDDTQLSVPYMHRFQGVKMMFVPAGCFEMGSDDLSNVRRRTVCIDNAFWIDRYEVSQEQFERFEGEAARASQTQGDDLPHTNITAYEAAAFCEKRGARLPTEAEWEYAARGPDSLRFPWGDEIVEGNVNPSFNENGSYIFGYNVIAVDWLPDGDSWVGARQMSGNVWEWTTTPDGFVFKGGSYTSSNRINTPEATELLQPANRSELKPTFAMPDRGFRCARDYNSEN
jgi:formylglycine-generating enzyme required for sulfatase activity